jgi:RES domain-containing protein
MAFLPEGDLKAYRLADERYPIFDGGGAMLLGGRWNSPGRRVIYAGLTFAGAMLEVLVHTNTGRVPNHHAYIEISIPDTVQVERLDVSTAPGWDAPGYAVSRVIGDEWYDSRRSAVLIVPSVVSQVDSNVLIHQEHPDFLEIRVSEPRPVRWDRRLFRDC